MGGYSALVVIRRPVEGMVSSTDPNVSRQTTGMWIAGKWHTDEPGEVTHWMPLPEVPLVD